MCDLQYLMGTRETARPVLKESLRRIRSVLWMGWRDILLSQFFV
jgi:hypothetical protein